MEDRRDHHDNPERGDMGSGQARERFVPFGDGMDQIRKITWELRVQEREEQRREVLRDLLGDLETLVRSEDTPDQVHSIVRQLENRLTQIEIFARNDLYISFEGIVDGLNNLIRIVEASQAIDTESVAGAIEALLLEVNFFRSQD